ncbi:MAG TPA: endonuclease/exonuclease/phosphatase family protein [Actinomycetota bacterium]|nr:endonuclease/exonuclease/phosphatase family protein [Actinomycetota bacterium]
MAAHFHPDIVLLNETGSRRRLRTFARRMDMEVAADPLSPFRRRVKNAVLVGPPWRIVSHRLHRFRDVRRRMYPRGALIAQVGRAGYRLWAVSVHLGLHPLERLHAVQELSDLVRGLSGPVLIGGDFNETPERRAVRFLGERFWDAWVLGGDTAGETFPSSDPSARIDYLFVPEGVAVERIVVPPGRDARRASDHLPVVAELKLPGPDSPA